MAPTAAPTIRQDINEIPPRQGQRMIGGQELIGPGGAHPEGVDHAIEVLAVIQPEDSPSMVTLSVMFKACESCD
jgi:hypothetical protein